MRRTTGVLVCVAVMFLCSAPSPAEGDEGPQVQLTPAQRKQIMQRLQKARALYRANDYAKAMEELKAALDIDPDNPAALGELSLASFKAQQLAAAEEAALEALRASTGWERGAAWYNLGRVHEERGDKTAAVRDYLASLRARPSEKVRERLRALDAAAADSAMPFAVRRMLGPFASLGKLCDALHKLPRDGGDEERWQCDPQHPVARLEGAKGPWKDVRVIETVSLWDVQGVQGAQAWHLAALVGKNWYVAERIASACQTRHCAGELKSLELATHDLGGGAPAILLRVGNHEDVRGDIDDGEQWTIAGVGASGVPSVVEPFTVRVHAAKSLWDEVDDKGQPRSATVDMKLETRWDGRTLELVGTGRGAAELVGKHPLAFP